MAALRQRLRNTQGPPRQGLNGGICEDSNHFLLFCQKNPITGTPSHLQFQVHKNKQPEACVFISARTALSVGIVNSVGERLLALLESDGRAPAECAGLVRLMLLFAELPAPPDPVGLFPQYEELKGRFVRAMDGGDAEVLEEAFLALYCHVHGHEAPYTPKERGRVDETGGYWCHAGGLSPVLKAGQFIHEDTVLADFGAGNGLQGLLMQVLRPHRRTVQFEISGRMVEAGQQLQAWLGVPEDRVEWVIGDVLDASCAGLDFIYLYRPVRPEGAGRRFYEGMAAELSASSRPVVIFSIADCLREFLPPEFEVFYTDGHLTCYRRLGH